MERTLLAITSPPGSPEALRALAVACSLDDHSRTIALALLQDAVLAALKDGRTPVAQVVSRLLAQGVAVYVAQQDLTLRGFSAHDLTPRATAVDDRRIVDLMLADGTMTVGCF